MASRKHTPTVRLRRLAAELRRIRGAAGMSREVVSAQTGINYATLYRIETAKARPQMRTLTTLLKLYGVPAEQHDYMKILCRDAAEQGWLRPYHSDLPEEYTTYINFEAEATGVRNYESMLVPGLLQTEEYARTLIRADNPGVDEAEIERRVSVRMARQTLLTRVTAPPVLNLVLNEAILHRPIGGTAVMVRQLERLIEAGALPTVSVRVLPFSAGLHRGIMSGPFVMLRFPLNSNGQESEPPTVYAEGLTGALYLDKPHEIERYDAAFANIWESALDESASQELITRVARELGK